MEQYLAGVEITEVMEPRHKKHENENEYAMEGDVDLVYKFGVQLDCLNGHARQPEKTSPVHILTLVTLVLLSLFIVFTESSLIPALPVIAVEWGKNANWISWVVSACNVVCAIGTPIAGNMGDIYGPKIVTMVCLITYLIGQIGCILVKNYIGVIVMRAISGLGKSALVLMFATIKRTFPPKLVTMSIGIVSSMSFIGLSVGFVGGAALIDGLGDWHKVFIVTSPPFAVLMLIYIFFVPNPGKSDDYKSRSIDYIGAGILTVAVGLFIVGLTISSNWGWGSAKTILFIVIGVLLMPVFLVFELFVPKDPLIPFRSMLNRNLLVSAIINFTIGLASYSVFQIIPFMLQSPLNDIYPASKKASMLWVGVAMFPYGGIQAFAAPVTAMFGNKFAGFSVQVMVGAAVMAIANYILAFCHNSIGVIVVILIFLGLACCIINVSIGSMVVYLTTPEQYGSISGAMMLFLTLGDSIGSVIANQLKNIRTVEIMPGVEFPEDYSYKVAFSVLGIFLIISFLISWVYQDKFLICKGIRGIEGLEKLRAEEREKELEGSKSGEDEGEGEGEGDDKKSDDSTD